jgi:hypothetical protein
MPSDAGLDDAAARRKSDDAKRRRQRAAQILQDAAYYGPGLSDQGSYCTTAACLAHHRDVYFNLQERAWVHADGFECDGLAALAEQAREHRRTRQAAALARKQATMTKPCRTTTPREQRVIQLLEALGEHWPDTIMLVSMDGRLAVVDAKRYRAGLQLLIGRREDCILADIPGITNDGGSW